MRLTEHIARKFPIRVDKETDMVYVDIGCLLEIPYEELLGRPGLDAFRKEVLSAIDRLQIDTLSKLEELQKEV